MPPRAGREIFCQLKVSDPFPMEGGDEVSDAVEHALDLVIAAFVEGEARGFFR